MTLMRVHKREAGEKLLRFLERRILDAPPASVLHRWIRTGQVRINGGRAKPFTLLRENDEIRLPPFAEPRAVEDGPSGPPDLGPDLPVVSFAHDLLVLAKPAGLAVQPGTGLTDSVTDRLRTVYAGAAFISAPAHRLDAPTSGLLLVPLTQHARTELHAAFAAGTVHKEYLAWAAGTPADDAPFEMRDTLSKRADGHGFERVAPSPEGKEARAAVSVVARLSAPSATLLHILLHTGRTHQIRAQLAARALPLVGDRKYGGPPHSTLLLHCFRLGLPDGRAFTLLPDWPEPFEVGKSVFPTKNKV
jgi:23S rRNA pseudouridine955/2504/2580 synthase